MQTAVEELRDATAAIHQKLETLPYVDSVLDATLPVAKYASFLRAVFVIHETFERLLQTSQTPTLAALGACISPRSELLERDLAFFDEPRFQVDAAGLFAELFAQRLRWFAREEPLALAGVAYVLEGSALGGRVQVSQLQNRSEFAAGGLAYLSGAGTETRRTVERVFSCLNDVLIEPAGVEQGVRGALATFQAFEQILTALDPAAPTRTAVALLNAEAGQHAYPSDLREVAAALRAGELSWQRHGYYSARYGERGLRFTRSDSAWLAALARRDAAVVTREVSWLGRVLAHRGMPRYLLEEHLEVLFSELQQQLPEAGATFVGLLRARDALRSERRALLRDDLFFELAKELEDAIPPELQPLLHGSGVLVVSAVIDDACGITGAIASLSSWLGDAERFGGGWASAVRSAFERARLAVTAVATAASNGPSKLAQGAPDASSRDAR